MSPGLSRAKSIVTDLSVGLETNTTYYVYFVIKGAAQDLSPVYVYQFTTEETHKPRIYLDPLGSGARRHP